MIPTVQEHYRLPEGIPTVLVCLAALAALAGWVLSRRLPITAPAHPRFRLFRVGRFGARAIACFLALLLISQAAMRWLILTTNWPLWLLAAIGALAAEGIVVLYGLERKTVSARTGTALVVLRALLVIWVIAMLAQPVLSLDLKTQSHRTIAILLDDSGSMHVSDPQMSALEKARLADLLPLQAAHRPYRLEDIQRALDKTQDALEVQKDRLAAVGDVTDPAVRQKNLERIRDDLLKAAQEARKNVETQMDAVPGAPGAVQKDLTDIKGQLASGVRDRLVELEDLASPGQAASLARNYDRFGALVSGMVAKLGELSARLPALGRAIDEDFYAHLPADAKATVDALAAKTRAELAQSILLHRTPPAGGKAPADIVDTLRERGYTVKTYRFASRAEEFDFDEMRKARGPEAGANPSSRGPTVSGPTDKPNPATQLDGAPDPQRQRTNGGQALQTVASASGDGGLAAVFLLTDARFSDAALAANVARRLGDQKTPVTTVLMGSATPPRDAAVIAVNAPPMVYCGDKVKFNIELKLDGLAGQKGAVTVHKLDAAGKKKPDSTLKEEFAVPANAASFEMTAELSDEDTEKAGTQEYLVEVADTAGKSWDREVVTRNNTHPVSVNISDGRTRVLLIDGRPRWEFRYLKNLFSDRDPTVQLQYVLLEPDTIEGVPRKPVVAASATRPRAEVEAGALPGHAPEQQADKKLSKGDFIKEWKKFDVIILGDVARGMLTEDDLQALEAFVGDRGGTLVVISGPRYMPHAFGKTPLEGMLPVEFKPGDDYVAAGSAPARKPNDAGYDAFRIALTPEGERHVILRQLEDSEDNYRLWLTVPPIHWRHPIEQTKPGATVLAYACLPEDLGRQAEDNSTPRPATRPSAEDLRRREDYMRKNALVAVQNYRAGQVLFLAFDRTWRLRYRVGDTYHHKFWGQILRWGTGDKLPDGTRQVRLGTDKARYGPDDKVKVEAKILDANLNPLRETDGVTVKVSKGAKLVREAKMTPVPGSLGRFETDLGEIASKYGPGDYTVELCSPAVSEILRIEGKQDTVTTRFHVAEMVYDEQKSLAANPALAEEIARAGGGTVIRPNELRAAADEFARGVNVQVEHRQSTLWDTWPMLLLIVLTATAEWVLRKRAGLA